MQRCVAPGSVFEDAAYSSAEIRELVERITATHDMVIDYEDVDGMLSSHLDACVARDTHTRSCDTLACSPP